MKIIRIQIINGEEQLEIVDRDGRVTSSITTEQGVESKINDDIVFKALAIAREAIK